MNVHYQKIWIVVFAVIVIALYVLSKQFPLFPGAASTSFDEAAAICEKEVQAYFGEQLRFSRWDKSVSDHDKKAGRYTMIFAVQVATPRPRDLTIYCSVNSVSGNLIQLDAHEGRRVEGKPGKEKLFGWPNR